MKFERTEVFGLENALIGMRLPMSKNLAEAESKCDFSLAENENATVYDFGSDYSYTTFIVDKDTMRVAKNLCKADEKGGSQPNSKFLRMIHCQVAITAPCYFIQELSTYKIGTTTNSSSLQHTGMKRDFTVEDFTFDDDGKIKEILTPSKKEYESKITYPYETVDHLDGDKTNNSVENLEWVSREENARREHTNGLCRSNNLHADYVNWKKSSKILPNEKIEIRKLYDNGLSQKEISERFNISQSQVFVIVKGRKNTSNNTELFEYAYYVESLLETINKYRRLYVETKDYKYFHIMRQFIPMSYDYTFMFDCDYATLRNIYHWRKNHKLTEWHEFCTWIESLPFSKELITGEEVE